MGIKQKLESAEESSWLKEELSSEERAAAELTAAIAASIQTQRKALGYTQKELAAKLGVSQAMVSRWENGEENLTIATLAKLSKALNVELSNPLLCA
jgi:ribosome-binding protein aMBF1 (putative translation factor)